MTDKIIRVKIETGDSPQQINQLDNSMVKLGASTDRTTEEVAQLNTQMTKTAQGVSQATGKIGQVAQQAGFQIQDFANQVAGGQSALLAFGQQAPQFLGTFGPGGAVFGAIIAVSAAIGGVLVNAIKSAKEEAQELPGEVKKFAEEIGKKFANVDLSSRADLARVEIGKLNTEYEKTAEKLAAVTAELKDLDTFGPSSKFVKSGEQYTKAWSEANSEVKENTTKLDIIKQKLEQLNTISQTGLGTNSLDNLDDSSKKAASATNTLTKSLQIQKIALEEGELQAKLYAAANYLELDSISKLPPAIRDEIISIYNKTEAKKQQAEAQADLNKEITEQAKLDLQEIKNKEELEKRADRERQRINERIANMQLETDTFASQAELMRAVRAEQFTQEEADLAAQTASRLLAASTEFSLLMESKAITDAQKIEAERAFREQIAAINEQYNAAEEEQAIRKGMVIESVNQRTRDANLSAMSSGVSILETFLGRSNAIVKAARIAMGAYQAFSIYASSEAAAAAALAPPPIGLGPIAGAGLAGAISVAGKMSAAAVLASAVAGSFSSGGGGGSSIASAGVGSAPSAMPTTPQSAPTVGSFEIAGLADLQRQLNDLDGDEVLPVSFTRRLVASLESVQRLEGSA